METIHKRVLTFALALVVFGAFGQGFTLKNPAYVATLKGPPAGAGGGPDTWYDIRTSGETDTPASGSEGALEWAAVTVTTGGSATKARIYLGDNVGTPSVSLKMGLYASGGGSVIASGSVADAGSAGDDAYVEVTFDAPVVVTSATVYLIAWIASTGAGDLTYRFLGSSDNWKAKLGFGYANFPGTLPTEDFSLSRGYAVGVYVD